ncbi:probable E3 ubiquitin-protein ligase HERC4 isoform X2 [Halichondria panicea]|uniref:probable E3 ubiquitin-protein ligase HERC4 isoform X2 n=1 Tax=Halichondria panicea TaxID=6063 RepID=UPI00312BA5CF
MYCCGRSTDGQLGLGGIEENTISLPRWNKFLHDESIMRVGCGLKHTVILLDDGTMYSCGSNEKGQLGQDHSSTRPGLISALDTYSITAVACGNVHSVAIDDDGTLFTWGDNSYGQLGSDTQTDNKFFPMRVRSLRGVPVVQVSCGSNHTLALSQDGTVYSWGENTHFQLGHSLDKSVISKPTPISQLAGLPVLQLAAGGAHNFVLTRSLYVFGWGRNNFKQLGLGHNIGVGQPTEALSLSSESVRFISCGESHSAALIQKGEVLTFGAASSGQLGHGTLLSPDTPTKVKALHGKQICQVACGRMHTLAVDSTGLVYSFGQGSGGQLGIPARTNVSTPSQIDHDFSVLPPRSVGSGLTKRILSPKEVPLCGTSVDPPTDEPMELEEELTYSAQSSVESVCRTASMDSCSDNEQESRHSDWTNTACLRRVFAGGDQTFTTIFRVTHGTRECLSSYTVDLRQSTHVLHQPPQFEETDSPLSGDDYSLVLSHLSSAAAFNSLFLNSGCRVREDDCCVELAPFKSLFSQPAFRLEATKVLVKEQLLPSIPLQPLGVECLRVLYVLPVYLHSCVSSPSHAHYMRIFKTVTTSPRMKACLGKWFFNAASRDHLQATVKMASSLLNSKLTEIGSRQGKKMIAFIRIPPSDSSLILTLLDFLQIFHEWNVTFAHPLKHTVFQENIIFELIDLIVDFFAWIENKTDDGQAPAVIFCKYPFVLDARAKERLMMIESKLQMNIAVAQAQSSNYHSLLLSQIINDPSPTAYRLSVNRSNLIQDTMTQLVTTDELVNFKKPLHISFIGEEGEDAGGVQKEFFTLVLQKILSPDFGMFLEDDESHSIWFRDYSGLFEIDLDHFVLIGILCGLAIYNSVIVDIPFPMALYKKLLGWSPDLSDLVETFPSVGHGLEELLKYDGDDFTSTFDLNFTITRSVFGELLTINLVKDGANKLVTMETRDEYCAAFVDYTFNASVKAQFDAFKEGFMKVCDGKVLRMMHPDDLKTLVVGQHVVNWSELETHMSYTNGYSSNHPSITLFWEVFNEFPNDLKKKFLFFYTGSHRVPVAGVKSMNMIIQRMDGGRGCDKLPVAHTCFNVLDLPPYDRKLIMKQKLLQAINFTSGFGLI